MPELWTETIVAVASDHAEAVASFLLDLGSPGLVTEEHGDTITLTAFLAADAAAQLAALRVFCNDLIAVTAGIPAMQITTRPLPQADWAHNWMDHFPPLAVGDRLYIVPPWITEVPPGRIAIVIDPGLAFGTGHHATTQACLILLERAVRTQVVRRALDLGTGSGILAITLAKLGVATIEAVDNDPEACRAARENCDRNHVGSPVQVRDHLPRASAGFDLIVANLLSSLLIQLAPQLAAELAADAHLIASGILVDEVSSVVQAFTAHQLVECSRLVIGEWVTLDCIRTP